MGISISELLRFPLATYCNFNALMNDKPNALTNMENQRIFYDGPKAKIYYDSTLDTLFLEYVASLKSHDEFLEINSTLLEAFKSLNTQKMVADIRKMGIISIDSQNYVVNVLIPGMMEHLKGKTLYHAQFMDPAEVFAKVSAKNIQNKSAVTIKGFVVEQFTDRAALEEYLLSK